MITCVGPKDRAFFKDKKVYNVTSCSTDFCKQLSPMILGPCELYRGFKSNTMENAWQYSKVYKEFDDDGLPNLQYFSWALSGWRNPRGVRYPMGKGARPEYSFWNDRCYGYIEARQQIYIPLYSRAARNTEAFRRLKAIHDSGEDLILWDYDGRVTTESMKEVILNPDKPLGHSFVLKMMLEELI